MGNEQSAPTPPRRPPNKLSKPRTNNHSTTNLLDRRTSAPPSRRNSVSTNGSPTKPRDSAIAVDALGSEAGGRKEERQRKRRSLFRSKSAKPENRKLELDTDFDRSSVEPSPIDVTSHRCSREPRVRGNSMTTQSTSRCAERPYSEPPTGLTKPPMRSRMSLQTYTHHPRLSLVAELPSPQPVTADTIKRLSRYEEQEEDSPKALTQASRTNSESALYGPIRRRSLLQHGVATRTSFMESDPRSSLPSQAHPQDLTPPRNSVPSPAHVSQELQDYYYNPLKHISSSLSDLEMLGPNPAFAEVGPRTETPTELEHIGIFKLGTLRITNGTASPAPSLRSSEDDYVSAGSARRSQDSNHGHRHSQRSNTLSVPAEARKAPWIVRTESPLRQSQEVEKTLTIETQLPTLDPSLAWFDFEDTKELFRSTESPIKALELARDYQQDLALSPFSFENSPLPSPRLKSTSKNTAIEDDLFESEPTTSNLSERAPRSFDSGFDNQVAPPSKMVKGSRELPPKPLAKADSGYSSNISLRSFKRESSKVEQMPLTPPKEPASRVASSSYSVASAEPDLTIRIKRSLPSLPGGETILMSPTREAPAVPLVRASNYNYNKAVPNPPLPPKDSSKPREVHLSVPKNHARQKNMQAVPQDRSAREVSPADSEVSATSSTSSRWSAKSKLNKRPQSMQPPKPEPFTVQAFPSPSEELRIPPPSAEAQRHLEQRVDGFPVACFPNTFAGTVGLRHSSSKETLGTIFSVGSAEVRDELNFARLQGPLPPAPSEPSIPEHPSRITPKPEFNRRNTFQVAPVLAPAVDRVQKESRWARRSFQPQVPRDRSLPREQKAVSNEKLEEHLMSYSTISSSVGKSPYELAANTIPKPQTLSSSQRAKSMTAQFEADAAERFNIARANSRTRNRDPSPEPEIVRMRSYGSIAAGNPFASSNNSRQSSREHPPQAHANNTWRSYACDRLPPVPQVQNRLSANPTNFTQSIPNIERQDDERRYSTLSTNSKPEKSKSPPPVSIVTQRKMLPTPLGSHQIIPPSRTPPVPSQNKAQAPNRAAPAPPPDSSPISNQDDGNAWENTTNAWASRRQSAGEAPQSRKSMELRRPATHELRVRKSMDGSRIRRPSQEHERSHLAQSLKGYGSYDNSQAPGQRQVSGKMQRNGWNVGVGYEDAHAYPSPSHLPPQENWAVDINGRESDQQEYDHTYGSHQFYSNKENLSYTQLQQLHRRNPQHLDEEYYEPESHTFSSQQTQDQALSSSIHQRKTSTSEILVLDRFSGGLDYGYEPGLGLVGSAGTRNVGKVNGAGRKSVGVAEKWGVDLSDVPVFLQRVDVRVEG